jgi:hypothetical protein
LKSNITFGNINVVGAHYRRTPVCRVRALKAFTHMFLPVFHLGQDRRRDALHW